MRRKVALIHHSSPKNHITVTIRSDNADELKDKIAAVIGKENCHRKTKLPFRNCVPTENEPINLQKEGAIPLLLDLWFR